MPNKQSGFTLVELAIVLVIIGLLVGGVLRGKELLVNSQITSTIEQVKSYTAAMHTFSNTYNALPGDFVIADQRIPGCNASNLCKPGNGDTLIGTVQGTQADEPWAPAETAIDKENAQFWKHLSLAHLITGVDPSAQTPELGRSNPAAKVNNNGFFIRYTIMQVYNMPKWTGNILVMRKGIDGSFCPATPGGLCALSPKLASQLDRKMDDGVAVAGNVWGISQGWNKGCGGNNYGQNGPNGYNETLETDLCDMMFKVN